MLPLLPTALIAERKKYVYISKDFSGHRDTEEIENREQLMNCCDTIMSACRCESQSVCVSGIEIVEASGLGVSLC